MSATPVVKMYTRPDCGYCAAARQLLRQKAVSFEDININTSTELRREMEELSGRYTVPQIIINGQAVGGYDDIATLEQNGELDHLLGNNTSDNEG